MLQSITRNLLFKTPIPKANISSPFSKGLLISFPKATPNGFISHGRSFSSKKTTAPAQSLMVKPPAFLMFGEDASNAIKTTQPAQDNTANVYLAQPPTYHEEDKEAAQQLGVNYFYRSGNFSSFFVLKFDPLPDMDMTKYIEKVKLDFFSKAPYGTVSDVEFAPGVFEHLKESTDSEHIATSALFFDKKKLPRDVQRPAELAILIKTPGGFWNVACHTTFYNLAAHKDSLIGALAQNLRVDLKKPSEVKRHSRTAKGLRPALRKRVKDAKPSAAIVGNINLGSPKDLLDDYNDAISY